MLLVFYICILQATCKLIKLLPYSMFSCAVTYAFPYVEFLYSYRNRYFYHYRYYLALCLGLKLWTRGFKSYDLRTIEQIFVSEQE